ncbi:hypothetical protein Tco_1562904 [Tanacetum coccineum]
MHERPVGKIGVYTRLFEYANFRLPLSTFLIDVLSIEPTVGLFRCFYVNSNNKGWMSFSKRFDNSAVYPLPKSTEFNVDDYVVLVAHPAPFQKFLEPFLYLFRMSRYYTLDDNTYPISLHDNEEVMDLFDFIHVVDPTKVQIVERERAEGESNVTTEIEQVFGHLILSMFVWDYEYSICSRLVIKERNDVLHVMIR